MNFSQENPPLTDQQIRETETRLGVTLPDAYKKFLQAHHGAHPEPCAFRFRHPAGNTERALVAYFLSPVDPDENIFDDLDSYEERIPDSAVPIARDPGGNPILLAVSGDNQGKIYFWLDEPEDWDSFASLAFVADSFQEFIDSLID